MPTLLASRPGLVPVALALAAAIGVAGCGGGGGGGTAAPVASGPTGTTPTPADTTTPAQAGVSFANVSVHDPSVVKVADTYYIFGSHLAAAKSTDLMNWTKIADGVTDANPLFNKVTMALAETFNWAQVTDLWAPDVIQLDDGKYYMYYDACQGSMPLSALGLAVADKPEGPYVNKQVFLKSGMSGAGADGAPYNAYVHPNVVDPNVFRDAAGKLWMVYGSYSGGIFIMEMDPATGLPKPGQGYGKHLMGGNHARIEGAYVIYSPQTKYYYLFSSWGGLAANGGYNLRVARSLNPDGPYLDASGKDMNEVKSDPSKPPTTDDASIAPYGQKLMGNYQYALAAGETGAQIGYVSPGHNSVKYEASTGQYFLIFHTRFPGQGEVHEVRTHEMFLNDDGWLVAAPLRYVPLSKSATLLSPIIAGVEVAGTYKMVNHGKDITASVKQSTTVKLGTDRAITGSSTGAWTANGNNSFALTVDGVTYSGVLSRQWNPNANAFTVTFSAQSKSGVSIWGVRTGG